MQPWNILECKNFCIECCWNRFKGYVMYIHENINQVIVSSNIAQCVHVSTKFDVLENKREKFWWGSVNKV
jgi:hypothetical protein